MARKTTPGSERSEAARLTIALERCVSKDAVRAWRAKGWNLSDIPQLKHNLNQQLRQPKQLTGTKSPKRPASELPPAIEPGNISAEIQRIEGELAACTDYETARMLRMKLTGLKDAFRLHKERGEFVTKESQIREGLLVAQVIRAEILKIPAELPQMLVGLDYPTAVARCEQFADHILTILSDAQSYGPGIK